MSSAEGWLAKIAIATFVYYTLTFAFEIGYFWDIGVGYMSAFSISEHAVHAASATMASLGAIAAIYFIGMYPAVGLKRDEPSSAPQAIGGSNQPTAQQKISFAILIVLAVGAFGLDEVPRILREGLGPAILCGMLLTSAMVTGLGARTFGWRRIFWVYPALIAAVLAPFAFGQSEFKSALNGKKAIYISMTVSGKPTQVPAIFLGTERMLVSGPKSPIFVSYPEGGPSAR